MKSETRLRASDAQKDEFARALLSALARKNMNQSELARRVGVTRDAISTYVCKRSLPGPDVLKKIARVLEIDAEELLPSRYSYTEPSPFGMEMRPNGMALLRVEMEVPMAYAIEVIAKLQTYLHANTAAKRSR